jgi:hypothetical protein
MTGTRGRSYQRTTAGKGSQLAQAISDNNAALAKQIYADTTTRFDAIYPPGDRQWFENWKPK